jgi:AraC-like DNA-binding protein
MFKAAEQLLMKNFSGKLTSHPCIDYAGYSSKHLIQMFKSHVGVPPKSFLRIIRFQKAVKEIEKCHEVNWASFALDCGYFDQSHFISDFKAYSGFTPTQYVERKNDVLNYVPVG